MNRNDVKAILDELFFEAKNKRVRFDTPNSEIGKEAPWMMNSKFFVKINGNFNGKNSGVPVAEIPNEKLLIDYLMKYLDLATKFYAFEQERDDLTDRAFIKRLIFDLFINCSVADLNDVYRHIKTRTEMLKEDNLKLNSVFLGYYQAEKIGRCLVTASIMQNHSCMESPLRFQIEFMGQNGEEFMLPAILYGIDGKTCYIGAVQNFYTSQKTQLSKKLDRHFRKVNKDIPETSIESEVSPNAVVAFAIFVAYLKQIGVNKVCGTNFLPIRYQTKFEAQRLFAIREKKRLEEKQDSGELLTEKEKQLLSELQSKTPSEYAEDTTNKIQFNVTNRFTYLFARLEFHFDNLEFDYSDYENKIYLKLNDKSYTKQGNIIEDIVEMVKQSNIEMQ